MEPRLAVFAHEGEPLFIALYTGPGQLLAHHVVGQRPCGDDASHDLQAIDHHPPVVLGGEVVVADRWRLERIARADRYRAPRLDLELRYRAGEAREGVQHAAAPRAREIDEVDLRVRALELRPRAHERGGVARGNAERSRPVQEILQADAHLPE